MQFCQCRSNPSFPSVFFSPPAFFSLPPAPSLFPSLSLPSSLALYPTLALSLPSISFSLCFSPSSLSISPLRGRCDGSVTLTDSDCLLRAVSSCHIHQSHTFISSYYTALFLSPLHSPLLSFKTPKAKETFFPAFLISFWQSTCLSSLVWGQVWLWVLEKGAEQDSEMFKSPSLPPTLTGQVSKHLMTRAASQRHATDCTWGEWDVR